VSVAVPLRLGTLAPVMGLVPVDVEEANALSVDWVHYLGRCDRPFRSEGWCLDLDGEPIATAITSSIVSSTVDGYRCQEVVELARLCARERWVTRVMLRLWREVCAPRYACWTPLAAVAYSQTSRHEGDIYRFDGWKCFTEAAGSSGGGTWARKRYATDAAHGKKKGWIWRYPSPTEEEPHEHHHHR
jgi:hypothetical protein